MDFYEYLGIDASASPDTIKKAFRYKAKQIHPDYNHKDTAFYEMVELNLIHDTLLTPAKRQAYDLTRTKHHSDHPHFSKSSPQPNRPASWLHALRSIFIYRCRICGTEMSSTWQGYCLYHFLEVSGQLANDDHSFMYHGYQFFWKPPAQHPQTAHQPTSPQALLVILIVFIVLLSLIIGYYFINIIPLFS